MGVTRSSATARRRFDPERRQRLALAALTVVAERGVEGLTHRAVARHANVPLGSTTYHYSTLDDLLEAALRQSVSYWAEQMSAWAASLPEQPNLALVLADLCLETLGSLRERAVIHGELRIAALRRRRLRPLCAAADAMLLDVLRTHVDELTARALAVTFTGLSTQALAADEPLSHDEVEAIFRFVATREKDGRHGSRFRDGASAPNSQ